MKALILNGARSGNGAVNTMNAASWSRSRKRAGRPNAAAAHTKLAYCVGCFSADRTPGVCRIDDDARDAAQGMINSDLVIYLTPVTLAGTRRAQPGGGPLHPAWSRPLHDHPAARRIIARALSAIRPDRRRRLRSDPKQEQLFKALVGEERAEPAAISRAHVVTPAHGAIVRRAVQAATSQGGANMNAAFEAKKAPAGRRCCRWVAPRASTSESLGGYLLERLAELGWQTETVLLHRALRTEARAQAMLEAVDAADLVILAFPVHVDTLPYLATEALERIAAERGHEAVDGRGDGRGDLAPTATGQSSPYGRSLPAPVSARERARFLAIANCGFPRPGTLRRRAGLCRQFAGEAGSRGRRAGAGGGGAINGQPLAQANGMAREVVAALDAAAAILASGAVLTAEIEAQVRRPMMPKWLYLLAGNAGWLLTARKNGTLWRLGARPLYEAPETA
jgi:multimeric flavodoxin WrbA